MKKKDALLFLAPLYLSIRILPTGFYKHTALSRQWIRDPFRYERILYHNNPIIRTGRHRCVEAERPIGGNFVPHFPLLV